LTWSVGAAAATPGTRSTRRTVASSMPFTERAATTRSARTASTAVPAWIAFVTAPVTLTTSVASMTPTTAPSVEAQARSG
jgi:hypothetical protein